MESPENGGAVFRPSHKPWKSIKPISTFPPPRQLRDIYENIPKRSHPKLPASTGSVRLIPGLEKTPQRPRQPRLRAEADKVGFGLAGKRPRLVNSWQERAAKSCKMGGSPLTTVTCDLRDKNNNSKPGFADLFGHKHRLTETARGTFPAPTGYRFAGSGRLVGYSYLGVSGITPSLCYPEYRALAQNSAIEAINCKVGRPSMQNHAPQP